MSFLAENFLLNNKHAQELYDKYAKEMPIFDYHCHLSPKEIWENKPFENITQAWLGGDHYKWRAMRLNGVKEEYITGNASDEEKFLAWAETVPKSIGNPLYHWTHMELKNYFNIDQPLDETSGKEIWEACNRQLQQEEFTPRQLIKRSNVKALGTTDDPTDNLIYHKKLKEDASFTVKVIPTFRPDGAIKIEEDSFTDWVDNLASVTNGKISTFDDFLETLKKRVEYFHEHGCRASDHDMTEVPYEETDVAEVETIFNKRLNNIELSNLEILKYKTYLMTWLGEEYARLGWVMQLHIGVMRSNNTQMLQKIGPNTGFDSIGDQKIAYTTSKLLDGLDKKSALPKTVLYSVNPNDNYILASMIGNFTESGIRGKVQFGSAWWFNDHIDGMRKQLIDLASVGLLSNSIGMLTDSRSFLSYPRHDYFRRILCNIIGTWINEGQLPEDMERWGQIVQDICYNNVVEYFGLEGVI